MNSFLIQVRYWTEFDLLEPNEDTYMPMLKLIYLMKLNLPVNELIEHAI